MAGVLALAGIFTTTAALTIGAEAPNLPAGAASDPPTVTWDGNGTTNGMCTNSEDLGVTVPDGQQAWLFILTSPGSDPFQLTTNLGNATGTQEGDGSVHFLLFTSLDAVLTSASAVTGTTHSVLTVSGCQFGAAASTTTTSTTTTSTTTVTSGTTGNSGSTSGVATSASTSAGQSTASSSPTAQSTANHSGLAFTGAHVSALLASGLLLIATGSALVFASGRRRRRQSA
jgi:hypothetical protein